MTKKKTVGKLSAELLQSATEYEYAHEDIAQQQHDDYIDHLKQAAERGYETFKGNFYVHVIGKQERLMPNVIRNYFTVRETCPTPNYDESVWLVERESDNLIYLWTVPNKAMCEHILRNPTQVPDDYREIQQYVIQHADGTLLKACKKLNNEQPDSPLLLN